MKYLCETYNVVGHFYLLKYQNRHLNRFSNSCVIILRKEMFVKNSFTCLPKLTSVKVYQTPKYSEYQCNIKSISQATILRIKMCYIMIISRISNWIFHLMLRKNEFFQPLKIFVWKRLINRYATNNETWWMVRTGTTRRIMFKLLPFWHLEQI